MTGYPWNTGDQLFAADLNAAIANMGAPGTFLPADGSYPMTGPLMLAGNATLPLEAVPLQQVQSSIGMGTGWGLSPTGNFNSLPFGTFNTTTALSTIIAPNPSTQGTPPKAQINGFHGPSEMATFAGTGAATFYCGCDSGGLTTTVMNCTFTTTTMTPPSPLSATLVTQIQNSIAATNYQGNPVGMMIDVSAGTQSYDPSKYSGNITAVAPNGSSITVGGWFQQGNTAAGQVPPNGWNAFINPMNNMWAMNGIVTLEAGSFCRNMTYLEADVYNNQAAYTGGGNIPTIGISCNSHGNTNGFGFLSLGNWWSGFLSRGTVGYGYLLQWSGVTTAGSDPPFGFVSQVSSAVSGGHHPFAYWDWATSTAGYRWSVGSNGGMNLGNPGYDNGFAVVVSAPGSAPLLQAAGPDTNINLRIVPKGTGMVQVQSTGISLGTTGPTWTTGAGAPSSTQPIGSMYANTTGAVGAQFYISAGAGAWNAFGSPPGPATVAPLMNAATAVVGTSLLYARQDHVHQTDASLYPASNPSNYQTAAQVTTSLASYAPLASPAFTGTPSLPTGTTGITQTAGNNTTALATTAFVTTATGAYLPLATGGTVSAPVTVTGTTASGQVIVTGAPAFGFLSQVASNISGGHHPFAYYDPNTGSGQYRFSVASNGTITQGYSGGDNGLTIATALTGSPIVVSAGGPDANINIRIVAKGTGMIQLQTGIQLGTTGPTWTTGAGAPASTQPVGSIYSNTSGAAGARLYVSAGGGTWTAISGV